MLWWIVAAAWATEGALPWDFSAREATGDVRVLPLLTLGQVDDSLVRETWIGLPAPPAQERVRRRRTSELQRIPHEIGLALPGAVNGELGPSWSGDFHLANWPEGTEARMAGAIERQDWQALRGVARAVGGDAVLVTWLTDLVGDPITASYLPGDVAQTAAGPVVVDLSDEPYLVSATIGAALVTRDGEVCVRYSDTFNAILSARYDAPKVGRQLARGMATELTRVWVRDGELDR